MGLVLLATFYPSAPVQPLLFAGLVGAACAIAWGLRKRRVASFWPYLILAGTVSWLGFYLGGLHPALRSRIRGYGYEVYVNSVMPESG